MCSLRREAGHVEGACKGWLGCWGQSRLRGFRVFQVMEEARMKLGSRGDVGGSQDHRRRLADSC